MIKNDFTKSPYLTFTQNTNPQFYVIKISTKRSLELMKNGIP